MTSGTAGTCDGALERLLEELERLPAHPTQALRVLQLLDDPRSSASEVGGAAGCDPVLSTRLLRAANSAYYGLSGRVSSIAFAVTVLGFSTVRAMAAVAAGGLLDDCNDAVPPGFWEHSASSAAACAQLARRMGVERNDAFSVGLLHDIGEALLCRLHPDRFAELPARPAAKRLAAEKAAFGVSHDEAAARVLAAWRFPQTFVDAVAGHHSPPGAGGPWVRLLVAADALADRVNGQDGGDDVTLYAALAPLKIDRDAVPGLLRTTKEESAHLIPCFAGA